MASLSATFSVLTLIAVEVIGVFSAGHKCIRGGFESSTVELRLLSLSMMSYTYRSAQHRMESNTPQASRENELVL